MPSDETNYGRVVDTQPVGTCALGQVLRGREQQTNLPAVVFEMLPEHCSEADKRWLLVRQLRPRPEVVGPTVIEVQSTPRSAFVSVAWPVTALDPSFTPPELDDVVASFLSGGASVSAVLAKLVEIEPRSIPATVAINSQQIPAIWPPQPASSAAAGVAGASLPPEASQSKPEAPLPIGQTRFLPSDAPPLGEPASARSLSPGPRGQTPTPRSRAATPSRSARPSPLPARARATPVPGDDAPPRKRRRVPAPVLWLGPSVLVLVVLLIVWAFTRPAPPTPPPTPGDSPAPMASPQDLPEPVQLAGAAPDSDPKPAPIAPTNDEPAASDEKPAAQDSSEIVVVSSPAGAQICDPRSGKVMGNTPLSLPLEQWRRGYKLVLTAPGYKPAEMRWPPKRKIRLKHLGDDEMQPPSPCIF